MKIMITGAGGFLGSRLLSFYRGKYEVWGTTHKELDFTDGENVREALERFRPDVLIHCGAVSDVGTCEKEPERSFPINVTGSENLAKACAGIGTKMILCSSDQVYFADTKEEDSAEAAGQATAENAVRDAGREEHAVFFCPHREDERLNPRPVYGRQKLLAEGLCLAALPSCVCLRLTWMYDVLTEKERRDGRGNLATMFLEAMEKETPLAFSATDHRGVTDVKLVVQNMEKAWKLPGGVYNYGSAAAGSMYETMCRAAQMLEERMGTAVAIKKAGAGGLRNLTMDTQKAQSAGIWFPETAEGMAGFLASKEFQGTKS